MTTRRVGTAILMGVAVFLLTLAALLFVSPARAVDGCYPVKVTGNTPTGIAGCIRFGDGIGSEYGKRGFGVAMNFCTWTLRHSTGCGEVLVSSKDTGRGVIVPVVDFCDCYTGTPDERIVDMLPEVVKALGLDPALGLYPVNVMPVPEQYPPAPPPLPATDTIPNTAMAH